MSHGVRVIVGVAGLALLGLGVFRSPRGLEKRYVPGDEVTAPVIQVEHRRWIPLEVPPAASLDSFLASQYISAPTMWFRTHCGRGTDLQLADVQGHVGPLWAAVGDRPEADPICP
jgi:hypothetical protein